MTLLVLAIVGLMVLVVTVSPPRSPSQRGTETPTATESALVDDPDEFDVTATLNADEETLAPQTIQAELGDEIEIIVEGRGPASVALGDLQTEPYEQGLPARFRLLAETRGAYPLVLIDEDRQIGTLEIR
jgi:hypothetical protein